MKILPLYAIIKKFNALKNYTFYLKLKNSEFYLIVYKNHKKLITFAGNHTENAQDRTYLLDLEWLKEVKYSSYKNLDNIPLDRFQLSPDIKQIYPEDFKSFSYPNLFSDIADRKAIKYGIITSKNIYLLDDVQNPRMLWVSKKNLIDVCESNIYLDLESSNDLLGKFNIESSYYSYNSNLWYLNSDISVNRVSTPVDIYYYPEKLHLDTNLLHNIFLSVDNIVDSSFTIHQGKLSKYFEVLRQKEKEVTVHVMNSRTLFVSDYVIKRLSFPKSSESIDIKYNSSKGLGLIDNEYIGKIKTKLIFKLPIKIEKV